jgi:hypothetical protein
VRRWGGALSCGDGTQEPGCHAVTDGTHSVLLRLIFPSPLSQAQIPIEFICCKSACHCVPGRVRRLDSRVLANSYDAHGWRPKTLAIACRSRDRPRDIACRPARSGRTCEVTAAEARKARLRRARACAASAWPTWVPDATWSRARLRPGPDRALTGLGTASDPDAACRSGRGARTRPTAAMVPPRAARRGAHLDRRWRRHFLRGNGRQDADAAAGAGLELFAVKATVDQIIWRRR